MFGCSISEVVRLVGKTLAHYRILERLGDGGMGVVYKAVDTRLDRFVALKTLVADKFVDPERNLRFIQEAKAASALNHPNIIHIYDIAEHEGVDFIAMEFVDGETVEQTIPPHGMRVGDLLNTAIQIADALGAAHSAGIIHRDLKPANVMVTASGLVKVLDFGLAKLQEPSFGAANEQTRTMHTQEGTILGTAAFMSPEQVESRSVDARSDIFSFGCVLYEMATGQRAFQGDSILATLTAVLRDEPIAPSQIAEGLPLELERIILRCLRKDPARRFQGMADLKVALEDLKAELGSSKLSGLEGSGITRRATWIAAAAVIIFGAVVLWIDLRRPMERGQSPPVPLTSYTGLVRDPAFSPDGNAIAFDWNGDKQDNFDVYVKLLGPGPPLRLTMNPAVDRSPSWSPDGRQIAFLRTINASHAALMLAPALGGAERSVAEGGFGPRIAWSRDGQFLILSRRETPRGGFGLVALSAVTGEVRRITPPHPEPWAGDTSPALSPDGRTLAFVRSLSRSDSQIFLLSLNEGLAAVGQPRQLTFESEHCGTPAWTPDGQKVVFSRGGGISVPNLMVIPAAETGTKAERVTDSESGESPTISRQGKLVYIHWIRDENIWRLPLSGGKLGLPEPFIISTRRDVEPRFSPDGTRLTFTSNRSGSHQVWLCAANGSNQTQLTSLDGPLSAGARWSPDNQRIVFLSHQDNQIEIYLTTTNGGIPVRLTNNPAHDSAPSWSRDGKWIYFTSNRQDGFQVWKMRPDRKDVPVRVTRSGGYSAVESVDGKTLYYSKQDDPPSWGIWKVSVAGGEEMSVIAKISNWGDFDVTDAGIYYVDSPEAGARLRLFRFVDRRDVVLATIEKRTGFGVTASPDNRAVLYTQFDQESTEMMLVENSSW